MEDSRENLSILYIDDDEDEYIILKHYLTGFSKTAELHWYSSYAEGIARINGNGYDICIIDYRLGQHSGIELIKEIRAKGSNIPILFFTGQGDPGLELEAIKNGANDFLDKSELNSLSLEEAITSCIRKSENRINPQDNVNYDSLTSLPNEILFQDRLAVAIQSAKRYKRILALLSVNIDDFHEINSRYGRETGDLLLVKIARKLLSVTRGEKLRGKMSWQSDIDTVARIGGDSFAILLPEITRTENAAFVADRIQHCLSEAFDIGDHSIHITASIGIAIHPDDSATINSLLTMVSEALFTAKQKGKNCFYYHAENTDKAAKSQLVFFHELTESIKAGQLFLVYQPVVDVDTSEIRMIEAFLRWNHPEKGVLSAGDFISLITDYDLSLELEALVFAELGALHSNVRDLVNDKLRLNINLSGTQLYDKAFPERLVKFLETQSMHPKTLVLDVSYGKYGIQRYKPVIEELSSAGIRISLDNFGCRKSTFQELAEIHTDYLKIDSCITKKIDRRRFAAIAAGIIAIGKHLDINVVAENVETKEQAAALQALGCPMMQGNYYYHALLENLLIQVLKSRNREE